MEAHSFDISSLSLSSSCHGRSDQRLGSSSIGAPGSENPERFAEALGNLPPDFWTSPDGLAKLLARFSGPDRDRDRGGPGPAPATATATATASTPLSFLSALPPASPTAAGPAGLAVSPRSTRFVTHDGASAAPTAAIIAFALAARGRGEGPEAREAQGQESPRPSRRLWCGVGRRSISTDETARMAGYLNRRRGAMCEDDEGRERVLKEMAARGAPLVFA